MPLSTGPASQHRKVWFIGKSWRKIHTHSYSLSLLHIDFVASRFRCHAEPMIHLCHSSRTSLSPKQVGANDGLAVRRLARGPESAADHSTIIRLIHDHEPR